MKPRTLIALVFSLAAVLVSAQTVNVLLEWDNPVDATVTGYRMYQRSNPATNWVIVARVPRQATNIVTLTNCLRGSTYSWFATSTNLAGLESLPSNVVTSTIPAFVSSPVNMRVTVTFSISLP